MMNTIITAAAAIAVAVIEAVSLSERKRNKEKEEKRDALAAQRVTENRLAMKMQFATLRLSTVCANALTGGHNNGNVERARKAAQEAESEYENFIRGVAAEQMARDGSAA